LAAARRRSRRRARAGPAATAEAPKPEPLKAAWVYVGPVGDAGWTFAHDLGRKAVEAEFGDKVVRPPSSRRCPRAPTPSA
jgi:basic membrane lipoprotein Med (substrate-binding protein (PBP1-ABC) superfamily)